MSSSYSRQDVLNFLDYLADKGLMNKDTVVSRKAAVNTLLSILSEEEAKNLHKLDIDELLHRFMNLKGSDFKPASVRVYKSRLARVIRDFQRWKADPLGYKPNFIPKERAARSSNGEARQDPARRKAAAEPQPTDGYERTEEIVFPIPIRKGVVVKVAGIPSDLTPEEAQKIGAVVLALSGSQEGDDP